MIPSPLHQRPHARLPGLLSQLGAALLILVLLGLSAPGQGAWLVGRLDMLTLLLLAVWLLVALLAALSAWARDPARPERRLTLGLVPLAAGVALAGLAGGEATLGPVAHAHCSFVLGFGFATGRLQMLGLLGTASVWLGMLPAWWAAGATELGEIPEGAPPLGLLKRLRPHMGAMAAVALWLVGAAWTLLDPLMPAKAAVGGQTVLSLWWLMAALPVFFLWARFVPARNDQARCAGLVTPLAFGVLGLALGLLPRAHFLSGASILRAESAELVFVSAWLRMGPSLLVACALAAAAFWPGAERRFLRRLLILGVVALVAGLLGLGQELALRQGLEQTCNAPLVDGLQLPRSDKGPVTDPLALWGLPAQGSVAQPPRAVAAGPLGLAADRRMECHALLDRVEQAARLGWKQFELLYEAPMPDERACARQERLYLGLCPARRRDLLRAQTFRLPRLGEQAPVAPGQSRLSVHVLADGGRLELSLAAFGPLGADPVLGTLGGDWPHDAEGLASLAQALREVRKRFPDSQDLMLLVDGKQSVARLAELLLTVAWDPLLPGRRLYSQVSLDRSLR